MKRPVITIFFAITIVLLFTGCGLQTTTDEISFTDVFVSLDAENVSLGTPQGNAEGFFVQAPSWEAVKIVYADAETQKAYTVCSQPGCEHQDNLCPAYLGESASYAQYRDCFYAMIPGANARELVLQTRSATDATWTVLWKKTSGERTSLAASVYLTNGLALIELLETEFGSSAEEENLDCIYYSVFTIDIETGVQITLIPRMQETDMSNYRILGTAGGKAILFKQEIPADAAPITDIIKQLVQDGKTFDEAETDAIRYLQSVRKYTLAAMDLTTGETERIVSGGSDTFRPPADKTVVNRGKVFYYVLDEHSPDKLMMFDAETGVHTVLLERDGIGYFGGVDGKLYYIANEGGKCWWCYVDLETGNSTELTKNTGTEVVPLGIHYECRDWFLCMAESNDWGWVLIRKTDFYAENFDKIIPFDYEALASNAGNK